MVSGPSPFRLRLAARVLHHGGLVAYPTEAVYGLGCDPFDADAVYRLLDLKQRAPEKGLILIAADFAQLAPLLEPLSPALARKVNASWPGAKTWLLPAKAGVPRWLTGAHSTLAVRVTAHTPAAALCAAFGGAVVSTSANLSGHRAARNTLQVHRAFGHKIDYILAGEVGSHARPSEIRDAMTDRIVRSG